MTAVARMLPRLGRPSLNLGASETSERLAEHERRAASDQRLLASDPYATPADVFGSLVEEWRDATRYLSSTRDIVAHPAYLRIIALGNRVTPLVLRELSRRSEHWFVALKALTGGDPVDPDDWGNIEAMRTAWIRWGRERGLV
jgi:hypothetical protein